MRISDWSSDVCSSDLSTPGPTIEAVEGDRVRIYATNRLPEATSVHWHGILLPSAMDGVAGHNQPAISPDETFVYKRTLHQHGTPLYHPHADEITRMALGIVTYDERRVGQEGARPVRSSGTTDTK